tara:strand:+ start:829 stop:2514 length:1686 start_codon:yes stop_codon:yes gene_type:complete
MMKNLCSILIILFFSTNIFSQNSEGEIEDAQILIEKNNQIILQKSDKKIDRIDLETNNFKKKSTSFDLIDSIFLKDNRKIDKVVRKEEVKQIIVPTKLTLLGGNYKGFLFNFNPSFSVNDKLSIFSDFFIKSNSKGSLNNQLSQNKLFDNNLSLNYKLSNYSSVNTNLSYKNTSRGFYGFRNRINVSGNLFNDLKTRNNIFDYNFNWRRYKESFEYRVSISGKNYRENSYLNLGDNSLKINGNISFLRKKIKISFNPSNKLYELGDYSENQSKHQYHIKLRSLELPLLINIYGKNFTFGIGGKYSSLSKELKEIEVYNGFYPEMNFSYAFKNLSFSLDIKKDIYFDEYYERIENFTYLYGPSIYNEISKNDINLNINSKINYQLSSKSYVEFEYNRLDITGRLKYKIYDGDNRPDDLNFPIYLYSLFRFGDQEIINNFKIKGNFILSDKIISQIKFEYSNYDITETFVPEYKIDIQSIYESNNFDVRFGLSMFLENHGITFSNESFDMDSFINLKLHSKYHISEKLSIHLNIDNILNHYNEIYFMYPELGTNLLSGLTWKF